MSAVRLTRLRTESGTTRYKVEYAHGYFSAATLAVALTYAEEHGLTIPPDDIDACRDEEAA